MRSNDQDDQRVRLTHIRNSIDNIVLFIGDADFAAYLQDRKTQAAVEREFQIISKAAIKLGADAEIICPGPDWPNVRGMGNWLRHEYHRVNHHTIWTAFQRDLPPLRSFVNQALTRLP